MQLSTLRIKQRCSACLRGCPTLCAWTRAVVREQASDTSIELTERRVSSKSASGPASHDSAHDPRAASGNLLEQVRL